MICCSAARNLAQGHQRYSFLNVFRKSLIFYLLQSNVLCFTLHALHASCIVRTTNTMSWLHFIAAAGQDYTGGSYPATFLAGQTTASVSILITNDTTAELTETFSAVLSIPATASSQGITKGAADTATIEILDDDTVEVVFNPTQYPVNESDGVVTLTLNADKPASFEYTVEVETQDGTATGNLECYINFTHSSPMLSMSDFDTDQVIPTLKVVVELYYLLAC